MKNLRYCDYKILKMILCLISAKCVLFCMRLPLNTTAIIIMAIVLCFLYDLKSKYIYTKYEQTIFGIFSVLLGSAYILGAHIHIGGMHYSGVISENNIISFGWKDGIGLVVLIIAIWKITRFIQSLLKAYYLRYPLIKKTKNKIRTIKLMSILFICWLPYFLVYYPGHILGDSCSSIFQALGIWHISNHHPVLYTLFIRMCFWSVELFGGNLTDGLALYSLIQMLFLAYALGKTVAWLYEKGVNKYICTAVLLFWGITPFFANISIAVWKDPVFSAAILLWTILIFDIFEDISLGNSIAVSDQIKNIGLILLCCFSRNNGVYVVFFFGVVSFAVGMLLKKRKVCVFALVAIVLSVLTIIVPNRIYTKLGITPSEKVESVGLMLNQMARVVAYDGNMSDEDSEFMDELLPIGSYKEKYRPCAVDLLKWDAEFDNNYLETHMPDFFKTYISLLVKNPKLMFEGWELTTFGYWAPNRWELFNDTGNIEKGNLGDYTNTGLDNYINQTNILNRLFPIISWENIFRIKGDIIALANVIWMIIFVGFIIVSKKEWIYLPVLAPTMGVIITLWLASPYYYWQRYGLSIYYTIPVVLYLVRYCIIKNYDWKRR